MNKKRQPYYSYYIVLILFLGSIHAFSQTSYSEAELTGRGELKLVGYHYKLQKEVLEVFKKMQKEALNDGISIQIVSAYRSFNRQKKIWNKKYDKYISEEFSQQQAIEKIIEYSTIPGTSRHHWGTDIDIIDGSVKSPKELLIEQNYTNDGVYSNLKIWMDNNSEKYDFYLVYDNNPARKGFKYEPWHYSYRPLSKPMLKDFLVVDLAKILQKNNLKGKQLLSDKFLQKYYSEQINEINSNLK